MSVDVIRRSGASGLVAVPAPPDLTPIPCQSCGRPASVRRWYATSPTDVPEFACGRCALLTMGDTVGTIGHLLFDLGPSQ